MPTRLRSASALALCALLVIAVPAVAADPAPASVDWSVPPLPTNRPQTDDEVAFGRANGRPAPAPELLQPTLDPALPSFEPAYDSQQLSGNFHCAASDVLAVLSKTWIQQFQTYYPNVNISVDPPMPAASARSSSTTATWTASSSRASSAPATSRASATRSATTR